MQSALFKTKSNISRVQIYTKNAEARAPIVIDSSNLPSDTRVKITPVARPLLKPVAQKAVQVRTRCIHEQNVCSFSNITLHRNNLLFFLKHLPMCTHTRKYRISSHTDWWQNFESQEVPVRDKCSSSDKIAEIRAVPI
jgi:hypothetical protein